MITGVHAIMFGEDADATRGFLRDTLGLDGVDADGGWLIFKRRQAVTVFADSARPSSAIDSSRIRNF